MKLSMKSIRATVLEQSIIDFISPHFYFVRFPLSNLDSPQHRWRSRASRMEKDINLIQIHYISLHILTKSSIELSLIEACCYCPDRSNNKTQTIA